MALRARDSFLSACPLSDPLRGRGAYAARPKDRYGAVVCIGAFAARRGVWCVCVVWCVWCVCVVCVCVCVCVMFVVFVCFVCC